jgi:hypothetical protein
MSSMTWVEIYNATMNVALFGMMLWKRPRLPWFWAWQICSVAFIFVIAYYRHSPQYARAWWFVALAGLILEFFTTIELWKHKFSWLQEGAIILMALHLVFKSTEHAAWYDDREFAWQMRHIAVALNEIIGAYLVLLIYTYPKGESHGLPRRRKEEARAQAPSKDCREASQTAH